MGLRTLWFSLGKTTTFLRKCVFSLKARGVCATPADGILGGVPGTLSDAFFLTKLHMRKKCCKVASTCSPEAAKRAKLLPEGAQTPGPKPLSHENNEMSRNHNIYYSLATSGHLRKPLLPTIFGSKPVRESHPQENARKVAPKCRRKYPGGAQGCSKVAPRAPQAPPGLPK